MRKLFLLMSILISQLMNAQEMYLLVGTYDSPTSEGIYVYRFNTNTGDATIVSKVKTPNPSFIAVSPDENFVYAVHEIAPSNGVGGDIASFAFNKSTGELTFLNQQLSGGDHPCHVEVDRTGQWVFAANYSGGSLSVLPVEVNGSLGKAVTIKHTGAGPNPARQKSPHVHGNFISQDNKYLMTADLGTDKVTVYSFNSSSGELKQKEEVKSEPGSGPRMLTFHPNNQYAYCIEELTGTIQVYKYKNGDLKPYQRISNMMERDTGAANSADIHVSPDGKFLYASNRGNVNNIRLFSVNPGGKLSSIGAVNLPGKTPRNFTIDPTGKFLLVGCQNSDEIIVYVRDKQTGFIFDTGKRIKIGKPVCLKWARM